MANKSKEAERQNKALQDIMDGKEYVKDYVQVGYEGKGPENKGGETRKSELTDIMGKSFVDAYIGVKRREFETFHEVISSWEREFVLLNV